MKPHFIDLGQIGSKEDGYITVAQPKDKVPFEIKRVYWTYSTPENVIRGHHAHKRLCQLIMAVKGTAVFHMEDKAGNKFDFILDKPWRGLYIPPGFWRTIELSEGAVLLSLASAEYDEEDYIREYEIFKRED